MIYRFKLYGQRYAIDTASLTYHKLSELQYDMLSYLRFPLEDVFPSTLRYDLAKYESSKLAVAYMTFRNLWQDGVFNSDIPYTVASAPLFTERKPDASVTFGSDRFVFATDVIRLADSGAKLIDAKENTASPVKISDYDILCLEYERVAKEIIKRRTGRVTAPDFDFLPFLLPFSRDTKGYNHISVPDAHNILEDESNIIGRKIIECAVAIQGLEDTVPNG